MAGEGFLPPVVARLAADISEFQAKMGEAQATMQETTGKGASAFQKLAGVGKVALLGIGVAAVAVGVFSLDMADKYEVAHARLEAATTASGHKLDEFAGTITKQEKSFQKLGSSKDEYEAGLARLTQATNDPAKALQYMGVVADLAAARHMSLEQAATLVGKVLNGNTTVLKRLGIDLGTASGGAQKLASAQDQLAKAGDAAKLIQEKINDGRLKGTAASDALKKAYGNLEAAQKKVNSAQDAGATGAAALGARLEGSAAKQAETFSGQLKAMEATLKNVGIAIGMWLIPKLQQMIQWITIGINWLQQHKTVALILAGVIGGVLVAAIGAFIVSLFTAGGALAFLLSPIAAVVVGIGLVVFAAIWLWNNWQQVWGWIKDNPAIAIVVGILAAPIAAFVAIVLAAHWLYDNWSTIWSDIQSVVSVAWGYIGPVFDAIMSVFAALVQFFTDLVHGNWSALWDDFTNLIAKGIYAALQFFVVLPGQILSLLGSAGYWLLQKGADILGGLLNGMVGAAFGVLSWVSGLPQALLHMLGDVGNLMFGAGVAILNGLWDGLKSIAERVANWVADFASRMVDAVKGALGIGSPSKVFHEIGGNVMLGLLNGVQAGAPRVLDHMDSVAGAMTGGFGASGGAGGFASVGAGSGAGTGGGPSIVQNITIHGVQDAQDAVREYAWAAKTNGR